MSPVAWRGARRASTYALILTLVTLLGWACGRLRPPSRPPAWAASVALAYGSAAALAATLAIGPLFALWGRRVPVSFDLRRDLGISSAMLALGHVVFGLQVHMHGRIVEYFFDAGRIRLDRFGLANLLGVAATVVATLLLTISNDCSLARLGVSRWKKLQRSAYVLALLVLTHGWLYQGIEKRSRSLVALFSASAFGLGALVALGSRARRSEMQGGGR